MMLMKKQKSLGEILMGELIGEEVEITKSTQKNQIGAKGVIIDETLNTITIETPKGEKQVEKETATFKIKGNEINGKKIKFRPEDRIKKYWRKFDAEMRRH